MSPMFGQKAESHKILNGKLKKSNYKKLLKSAQKADVVFFGEMHDDPISHWMELTLLKDLHKNNELILALEMFERDNQEVLSEYLNGNIDLETFQSKARLWNNYDTDYAPLIEYAKDNHLKVIASNIPRRYATMVYKEGFVAIEGLVGEEKVFMAPLPIPYDPNLPGYQKMLNMVEGHGGENFPKAQAIKDATMAHSIARNFKQGSKLFHANGKYHSDNFEGIIWYLNKYNPNLNVLTISTVMEGEETSVGIADFIIVVDENMPKSY